jgi:hypothetical protein
MVPNAPATAMAPTRPMSGRVLVVTGAMLSKAVNPRVESAVESLFKLDPC